MELNITKEIALMQGMTVNQLKTKYREVFGESTTTGNKRFLIKRIAWRMQANIEGEISERARSRAEELANEADLRVRAPRKFIKAISQEPTVVQPFSPSRKDLMPGMVITRKYKGKLIVVTVLENGFEYDGQKYRSLTAVAEAVTGSHWNGLKFFSIK